MRVILCTAAITVCLANLGLAQVRITEWQYNGSEYVELTNLGPGVVDFTGWSFDDDSRTPNITDLSGFGLVSAGESVIISEALADDFRLEWGLPATLKVIGGNAANLGRSDEINIFNGPDPVLNLVDRLTYSDQNIPGTIRTQDVSGNPQSNAVLGTNNVAQWQLSFIGDGFGTYTSATGFLGNPGTYPTVPEPASLALVGLAMLGLAVRRG